MAEKECLTVASFAEAVDLPLTAAKQILSRREVRSFKVGKRRLIPVSEVRRWVEAQTAQAEAELTSAL